MKVYKNLNEVHFADRRTFIAIGTFDGVHRGHQEIFKRMVNESKNKNVKTVALTFNPLPKEFFGKKDIRICSPKLRIDRIEKLGVDCLLELEFTHGLSRLTPKEFIENILVKVLHAKKIFVGSDFSFGYQGSGNVSHLHQIGKEYDFTVEIVEFVRYLGERVSSTRIRSAIFHGDIELAQSLLGDSYCIEGKIERYLLKETEFILTPSFSTIFPYAGLYEASLTMHGQNYRVFAEVWDQTIKINSDLLYCIKDCTSAILSFGRKIPTGRDVSFKNQPFFDWKTRALNTEKGIDLI